MSAAAVCFAATFAIATAVLVSEGLLTDDRSWEWRIRRLVTAALAAAAAALFASAVTAP